LHQTKAGASFSSAPHASAISGNTGRDLVSFGNSLANTTFGNYFSRLAQLAQIGQGGTQGTANAQMAAGQAGASGIVGASNALNQGISGATSNLMLYNLLNKYRGQMGEQIPGGFTPAAPGELPWQQPSTSLGAYPTSLMPSSSTFGYVGG
jgi:hypothetical protein